MKFTFKDYCEFIRRDFFEFTHDLMFEDTKEKLDEIFLERKHLHDGVSFKYLVYHTIDLTNPPKNFTDEEILEMKEIYINNRIIGKK